MDKLEVRIVMSHFIGYPKDSMGYKFCIPKDNKIVIRDHAHFPEKEFIIRESGTNRTIVLKEVEDEEQSS